MPRETINGRYFGTPMREMTDAGTSAVEGPADNTSVQVGWDRYGGLQIGVVPAGRREQKDQQWVDLDRTGANALIRALRKGRDAAHGRDE